jgi:hypothetical protein
VLQLITYLVATRIRIAIVNFAMMMPDVAMIRKTPEMPCPTVGVVNEGAWKHMRLLLYRIFECPPRFVLGLQIDLQASACVQPVDLFKPRFGNADFGFHLGIVGPWDDFTICVPFHNPEPYVEICLSLNLARPLDTYLARRDLFPGATHQHRLLRVQQILMLVGCLVIFIEIFPA